MKDLKEVFFRFQICLADDCRSLELKRRSQYLVMHFHFCFGSIHCCKRDENAFSGYFLPCSVVIFLCVQ